MRRRPLVDTGHDYRNRCAYCRPRCSAPRLRSEIDSFCFWAANLGLAWAPFWLGSNRPIAWYANAIYFGLLVLVLEGSRLFWPRPLAVPLRKVLFPVLAFIAISVWIYFQAATWTPVQLHNPIWQLEGQGLDVSIPGSITINRSETAIALVRLLTEGAVFWLYLQLCRSPQRAYRTVQVVAFVGVIYAVYGIVAFYVFSGTVLWLPKTAYLDSVTSTFINRNSYATYAGLGLVCALGVGMSEYLRRAAQFGNSLARQGASFSLRDGGSCRCLGGRRIRVGHGARSDWLARRNPGEHCRYARVRSTGAHAWAQRSSRAWRFHCFGDGRYSDLYIRGFFCGETVAGGLRSTDRLAVYRLTLLSILDSPWTGFGYGTFSTVFAMYRDFSVSPVGMWDKAHNTYLEIIQGLGGPAAALFFFMLFFLVARCAYAALTTEEFIDRAAGRGG